MKNNGQEKRGTLGDSSEGQLGENDGWDSPPFWSWVLIDSHLLTFSVNYYYLVKAPCFPRKSFQAYSGCE